MRIIYLSPGLSTKFETAHMYTFYPYSGGLLILELIFRNGLTAVILGTHLSVLVLLLKLAF